MGLNVVLSYNYFILLYVLLSSLNSNNFFSSFLSHIHEMVIYIMKEPYNLNVLLLSTMFVFHFIYFSVYQFLFHTLYLLGLSFCSSWNFLVRIPCSFIMSFNDEVSIAISCIFSPEYSFGCVP